MSNNTLKSIPPPDPLKTPLAGHLRAWKYLTVMCPSDQLPQALEDFGSKGWELCSAIPTHVQQQAQLITGRPPQTMSAVHLVFKQPEPQV